MAVKLFRDPKGNLILLRQPAAGSVNRTLFFSRLKAGEVAIAHAAGGSSAVAARAMAAFNRVGSISPSSDTLPKEWEAEPKEGFGELPADSRGRAALDDILSSSFSTQYPTYAIRIPATELPASVEELAP